jgi:hypothetical protein
VTNTEAGNAGASGDTAPSDADAGPLDAGR